MEVKDKRRAARDPRPDEASDEVKETEAAESLSPEAPEVVDGEVVEVPEPEEAPDYLAHLQLLKAEFDNYRKRMMKQNAEMSDRGAARVVEQLLPVLDNFERAIAHGEGGAGVELVFKELRGVLESAGLEEVPAEGAIFDPQIHEAVEYKEDGSVTGDTVATVHRRGYRMKDKLLRPAMVGVVRPPDATDDETVQSEATGSEG